MEKRVSATEAKIHLGTLIRKAAEQGDAKAQYNLGIFYENGQGVDKSLDEAIKWFRLAAKQDLPQAQNALANLGIKN